MEKIYNIVNSVRGDFYEIELIKRYKGTPGFAPDYHDLTIGRVVVKFRDEEPYFQTSDSINNVLSLEDLNEIVDLLKRGFVEKDFNPPTPKE